MPARDLGQLLHVLAAVSPDPLARHKIKGVEGDDLHNAKLKCHPFAFAHVPKTGGTSVASLWASAAAPGMACPPDQRDQCEHVVEPSALIQTLRYRPSDGGFDALSHYTAQDLRSRMTRDLGEGAWEDAYTFSVVRNSYDMVLSQFLYSAENLCLGLNRMSKELMYTDPACLAVRKANATGLEDTRDPRYVTAFHDWLQRMDADGFSAMGMLSRVAAEDNKPPLQASWLTDETNDKVLVKEVVVTGSREFVELTTCEGLLSRVCEDQELVQRECAKQAAKEKAEGAITDTVHLKSSGDHPRSYYYTAEGRDIVRRFFAQDIERFGFEF